MAAAATDGADGARVDGRSPPATPADSSKSPAPPTTTPFSIRASAPVASSRTRTRSRTSPSSNSTSTCTRRVLWRKSTSTSSSSSSSSTRQPSAGSALTSRICEPATETVTVPAPAASTVRTSAPDSPMVPAEATVVLADARSSSPPESEPEEMSAGAGPTPVASTRPRLPAARPAARPMRVLVLGEFMSEVLAVGERVDAPHLPVRRPNGVSADP